MTAQQTRPALDRLMNPRTVAFVGIAEESRWAYAVKYSLEADAEFFFVHHKAEQVFGHRAYPDLRAIGQPVDAVFLALGAERTVDAVEQAAEIGAGGVITCAAGFAELGDEGVRLQQRMVEGARAGNMPVVGPNGVGLMNVPGKLHLSMLPIFRRRVGGLSAATHSGAMIEAMAAAASRAGGVGFNLLVSAGNEAVTDVADYLDYFAGDDATRIVALAIEKIRRPEAFFDAASRCLEAGKPIVAIKLGRSERTQRMAASHTGTLTGDAWVYDVAFKQAGILPATDIDDLIDRVQFLEQLPRKRWTEVRGLAILTATGGFAQLASDLAEVEGVDVPEVERLRPFVADTIPGGAVTNPLDITGFAGVIDGLWRKVLTEYSAAPEFDALLFSSQHAEWNEPLFADIEFAEFGAASDKPFVIAPLAGQGGQWLEKYRADGIAVGNGLRGCLRGLYTMGAFTRLRPGSRVRPPTEISLLPRPQDDPVAVPEGSMLPFTATMDLLARAGIPTAPYHLIAADGAASPPSFAGPYVVKLADVAHRTEHGAVRLGVEAAALGAAVGDLRAIAVSHGLPTLIAVQPMISGYGEAFIGINGQSELGPLVVFGLGGVFVEVMRKIGGRMAPMSSEDAAELIDEFSDTGVLDGFRGSPPWDRGALASVLKAASLLAAGGRTWIESIDINPLIVTADGPIAVDGLCLLRSPG
ncbi:acetate--CoA ligase family protein [Mycobacterium sp.]|uniref:acetate--CoA ligase family protein n=1 Tax=Mycobacterium sp. TaxID=1785 RepID=UPI003C769120